MAGDARASRAIVACAACGRRRRAPAGLDFGSAAQWRCGDAPGAPDDACSVPEDPALRQGGRGFYEWQRLQSNEFTHRAPKVQKPRDVMDCSCCADGLQLLPGGVRTGCGETCLNRMVFVECDPRSCPCGPQCSNQQFRRREYPPLEVFRAGRKGWGLTPLRKLAQGQFVIEYVGEVVTEEESLRRREEYAAAGVRHMYFMSLSSGELIDACQKGNISRFFNHSCEPNCEIQKWNVGGEVRIGFFSLRDIEQGEELTFDYNFERFTQNDKPMRCHCGAPNCKGVLGLVGSNSSAAGLEESQPREDLNEPVPVMLPEKPEAEAKVKAQAKPRSKVPGPAPRRASLQQSPASTKMSEVEWNLREACAPSSLAVYNEKGLMTVLRMFNLCSELGGGSARDMSLLLDSILRTGSPFLARFMQCKVLRQIQRLVHASRDNERAGVPILRKIFVVLEHLPLSAEEVASTRSGEESLLDSVGGFLHHSDIGVRNSSKAFLDTWRRAAGGGGRPSLGQGRPGFGQGRPSFGQGRPSSGQRAQPSPAAGDGARYRDDARGRPSWDGQSSRQQGLRTSSSAPVLHEKLQGSHPPQQQPQRQQQQPAWAERRHFHQEHVYREHGSREPPPHFRGGGGGYDSRHGPPPRHREGGGAPHAPPSAVGATGAQQTGKRNTKELWHYPDQHLDTTIKDLIRFRLFKYVHAKEHPLHIDRKTANEMLEKMSRVAQHKERKRLAAAGRELTKQELEGRLKKFVHQEMRQQGRKR